MADLTTKFDRRIDILSKRMGDVPATGVVDAAVYVHDTLETAWLAAESIFGEKATPDVALAIYDRIVRKISEQKADDDQE
jgi:hypothetical protein